MESARIKELQSYIHVLEGRLGMPLTDFSKNKKLQMNTNVAKVESIETGVVNTTGHWNSIISVNSITADYIIFVLTDKTTRTHSYIKKTPADVLNLQELLKKAPQFAMLHPLDLAALTSQDSQNAIEKYFATLMVVFLGNNVLANFLTSDAYNPFTELGKSGYLMKKAVGLIKAGWKSRFYSIEPSRGVLLCGDSPNDLSDFLNLSHCYISINNSLEMGQNCFWIALYKQLNLTSPIPLGDIEPTVEGFPSPRYETKHLLVAETVEARDDWARCIASVISLQRPSDQFNLNFIKRLENTYATDVDVAKPPISVTTNNHHTLSADSSSKLEIAQRYSPDKESPKSHEASPSTIVNDENQRIQKQIEPPKLAALFPSAELKSPIKKRGATFKDWVKKKSGFDESKNTLPVFGITLQEAFAISHIRGADIPTVLFRCIEYLEAKDAQQEEGLYRLSGSSSVIQTLRLRFDQENDVDLLDSDIYYDVHAVSGLLKLYFRELSEPILTKELRGDFLHITNVPERKDKISELKRLVQLLPKVNFETLKLLLGHLIRVIQNCAKNKMNVRNMSIVFSPTLGIPAGIFTLMMAEYQVIFYSELTEHKLSSRSTDQIATETRNADYGSHKESERTGSSRYPSYGSILRNNSEQSTSSASALPATNHDFQKSNSGRKRDTLFGNSDQSEQTSDLLNDLKTSFK